MTKKKKNSGKPAADIKDPVLDAGAENTGIGDEGASEDAPSTNAKEPEMTQEDAEKMVMDHVAPEGVNVAFVTSDCNVFWVENEGSARAHARKQNLKLFRVEWD